MLNIEDFWNIGDYLCIVSCVHYIVHLVLYPVHYMVILRLALQR